MELPTGLSCESNCGDEEESRRNEAPGQTRVYNYCLLDRGYLTFVPGLAPYFHTSLLPS